MLHRVVSFRIFEFTSCSKEADGSVTYCIDFRKLNAKTVFGAEPVPNQEVILNRMGGDNFISRLDLTKGVWQVPPLKKRIGNIQHFPLTRV